MVKEFSLISELKSIRTQRIRLFEREQELSKPILQDYKLISTIYEWFTEILKEIQPGQRINKPIQRKKFLFILVFLYSPATLAGDKMKQGLRDEIASVLNTNEKSIISKSLNNIVFYYQTYKYFRQDIEYLYTEIVKRLRVKGLIE